MDRGRSFLPVILLGLAALYIGTTVPPFQSPDEFDHIERAYLLAQGQFFLENRNGLSSGGTIDDGLLEFMSYFANLPHNPDVKLNVGALEQSATITWSNDRTYETLPGTGYYFPAIYLPQAFAIWMGQAIDLSIAATYQLARFVTLGTGLIILGIAFRLVVPSTITLALFALPMMLFQSALPSIDFVSTSLMILALSLFLIYAKAKNPPSISGLLVFGATIFVVAGCRLQLSPLVLLPLMLGFRFRDARAISLSLALSFAIIVWYGFAMSTTVDLRVATSTPTVDVLKFYVTDPAAFMRVFLATLTTPAILKSYWLSFLGELGWLDIRFSGHHYGFLTLLFFATIMATLLTKKRQNDPAVLLTLCAVAVSAFILVFLSLLVSWTPHPAVFVHGVQGRYFLPIALILAYMTTANASASAASIAVRTSDKILLAALFLFSVLLVSQSTKERYFETAAHKAIPIEGTQYG